MNHIVLSLGSNIGNRHANLDEARTSLENKGISIIKASALYESEPVGFTDQDEFLNQVLLVDTQQNPLEVLESCLSVERHMGRIRTVKNGPRNIDIDLLFYHDEILSEDTLLLPHPRIEERRFLLEPLAELIPDQIHPVLGETMQEMLQKCPDEHLVVRSA